MSDTESTALTYVLAGIAIGLLIAAYVLWRDEHPDAPDEPAKEN